METHSFCRVSVQRQAIPLTLWLAFLQIFFIWLLKFFIEHTFNSFSRYFLLFDVECAKLRASRAFTSYMPSFFYVSYVPSFFYVASFFYVPYVFSLLYVPCVPYLPPLFKVFLSFDVPYELSPFNIKCGTTHSQSQLAGINKMMFQSLKRSGVLFSIKSN